MMAAKLTKNAEGLFEPVFGFSILIVETLRYNMADYMEKDLFPLCIKDILR